MKILFMCLGTFDDLRDSSVHIDVAKELAKEHEVWLACKNEGKRTALTYEVGIHVLRIHTGKLKNVGFIKKGINTILVEKQFKQAVKRYLSDVRFDLVLYTTPPITFSSVVKYVKKRDNAFTYLMLKDIFPQNAVDIGIISTTGIKGLVYKYFRMKEKELYKWSDSIGCMSPANCEYILNHNSDIPFEKVELCPNTTVIEDVSVSDSDRERIRRKYQIPLDKVVFVYGGNLGKPQGIPFLIDCLKTQKEERAFFLIVGQGTEYNQLENFIKKDAPTNCKLMSNLPKKEYENLVAACDIGMIFLDNRFTIPNFPSRILSYMKAKMPVIAVTDPNTDIGEIIQKGKFGWWCQSNDTSKFVETVKIAMQEDLRSMGNRAFDYMNDNYAVSKASEVIINSKNKDSYTKEQKLI